MQKQRVVLAVVVAPVVAAPVVALAADNNDRKQETAEVDATSIARSFFCV